jgi:isoaspartyl peptidase/L-asparaginase-like protein (Ntn-hydrolase superfamily)
LHVSLEGAANDVVMKVLVEQHGDGGAIALDQKGNIAKTFNTAGIMAGTMEEGR